MRAWFYFWTICFAFSASAFALITLLVLVRGSADLRQMFRELAKRQEQEKRA